jgi:hypothetical protein
LGEAAFAADEGALGGLTQAVYRDGRCGALVYHLAGLQPLDLGDPGWAGALQAEAAVLVQTGADGSGFLLQGGVVEEQISPAGAAQPTEYEAQAEIGILEVNPSPAARLTQVKVSLYNFGAQRLELTAADIRLVDAAGASYSLVRSEPRLPRAIQPGQTVEIELIVPIPAEGLGALRIFNAEFELADFAD